MHPDPFRSSLTPFDLPLLLLVFWEASELRVPLFVRLTQRHSNGAWVLLCIAIGGGIAAHVIGKRRLPLKRKRFEGRQVYTIEEISALYPDLSPRSVASLWREVAKGVEIEPGLLRPSDRFSVELGPVPGFGVADELGEIEDMCDYHCNRLGLDPETLRIETVDDYVRTFARGTEGKGERGQGKGERRKGSG